MTHTTDTEARLSALLEDDRAAGRELERIADDAAHAARDPAAQAATLDRARDLSAQGVKRELSQRRECR